MDLTRSCSHLFSLSIYTSDSSMWRIQAVTAEGTAFTNRLGLPEAWRGLREQDLQGVCQVPAARFVHAAGFIGGADTYDGVLAMARATLEQEAK
jgi:uncharacterized UPF0160 family protein